MTHTPRIWVDIETTGLDPARCAVIDIALVLEVDGEVVSSFRAPMAPFDGAEIDGEALAVSGAGLEEIWDRESPLSAWGRVVAWIGSEMEGRRLDRFEWAGHNIAAFDLPFVREALRRHGYAVIFASHRIVDTLAIVQGLKGLDVVYLPERLGLSHLAAHFSHLYEPHDPMEDAEAARAVYHAIRLNIVRWRTMSGVIDPGGSCTITNDWSKP